MKIRNDVETIRVGIYSSLKHVLRPYRRCAGPQIRNPAEAQRRGERDNP
jgi:hypothetical protein